MFSDAVLDLCFVSGREENSRDALTLWRNVLLYAKMTLSHKCPHHRGVWKAGVELAELTQWGIVL